VEALLPLLADVSRRAPRRHKTLRSLEGRT
jgi:hypothetical protein